MGSTTTTLTTTTAPPHNTKCNSDTEVGADVLSVPAFQPARAGRPVCLLHPTTTTMTTTTTNRDHHGHHHNNDRHNPTGVLQPHQQHATWQGFGHPGAFRRSRLYTAEIGVSRFPEGRTDEIPILYQQPRRRTDVNSPLACLRIRACNLI
jgi:hypothetical protein